MAITRIQQIHCSDESVANLELIVGELFEREPDVLLDGFDAYANLSANLGVGEFLHPVKKKNLPTPRRHVVDDGECALKALRPDQQALGVHAAFDSFGHLRRVDGGPSRPTPDAIDGHTPRYARQQVVDLSHFLAP